MATKRSSSPRFSRQALNMIILITSILILVSLTLPGSKEALQQQALTSKPISETDNAELFAENEDSNTLKSLDIIASKPVKPHQIDIQSWATQKGAKVLFVESREVPMVDIRLVFNAGSARDGTQPGLARFTNSMLNEGTDNYSVDDIARHFESLGANFSNGSYRDMAMVSLRTLSDKKFLDKALDLFYEIISAPSFPKDSIERIRKQLLISLEHQKQRPDKIASGAFYQALYEQHPYGIPPEGTDDSLKSMTQSDLANFYQRYYVASNLVIAIVGDITTEQAKAIANQIDTVLSAGAPASRLPTPADTANKTLHKVFSSTQSHVLMGTSSIQRNDPTRYALTVGNEILGGGGFASRLNKVIRQDKGLAYSVYSYFSAMAANGPFIMGLQTRNDQRQQALDLMRQTLIQFMNEGPTEQELNDAKENIINSFPLSIASNSSMVGNLGAIGFYDLPLDYLDQYLSHIEKVTVADIKKAFAKAVDPDQLVTITVGPAAPTGTNKTPSQQ
ncbi:MAG: peptidase M16 [Gammaproteobacteria bacterium]|nr:MAG: peptidase M16 [Gammaproteobacteria bacterium]